MVRYLRAHGRRGVAMGLALAAPVTSLAQAPRAVVKSESTHSNEFVDESRPTGTGLDLVFGLLAGYSRSDPADSRNESGASGYHLGVRGLLEVSYEWAGLGLGAGYFMNEMKGKYVRFESDDGTTATRLDGLTLRTRAGFAEVLPHFRIGGLRIGPAAHFPFGTATVFSPSPVASERTSVLGGGAIGWHFERSGVVLGVQGLTDLNIKERQVSLALLDLRWLIPLVKPHTTIREESTLIVRERVRARKVERTVEKVVVKEKVRFVLGNKVINFGTGRADLLPHSADTLRKLGRFLASNPDLWGSLEIEGHTDPRGGRDYNLALSQARADSVLRELRGSGVPADRMSALGHGFDRPVDAAPTPSAWEKNRRVEIAFVGVKDGAALRAFFDSLSAESRGK